MTENRFKINTNEIGHIYIDNPNGKHMSWIEVENTLNNLHEENECLKEKLCELGISDVKCYGKRRIDTGLEEWLEWLKNNMEYMVIGIDSG